MTSTEEITTKNPVPTNLLRIYNQKLVSSDEAVKCIKSGDNYLYKPGCCTPSKYVLEQWFEEKMKLRMLLLSYSYCR